MKTLALVCLTTLMVAPCSAQATATAPASLKAVPVSAGSASLNPANTRIDFVGTHEGAKPDPRKGGFGKFEGKATVAADGSLESVSFEIETASLWSEIPKLSRHLKNADFFDVREYPQAGFRSTAISAPDAAGKLMITGEFTLLKETKEIKIPATVVTTDEGLTLVSSFKIDRTEFGMDYGVGKVSSDVELTVMVGQATKER